MYLTCSSQASVVYGDMDLCAEHAYSWPGEIRAGPARYKWISCHGPVREARVMGSQIFPYLNIRITTGNFIDWLHAAVMNRMLTVSSNMFPSNVTHIAPFLCIVLLRMLMFVFPSPNIGIQ